jgi:hypothetical protein
MTDPSSVYRMLCADHLYPIPPWAKVTRLLLARATPPDRWDGHAYTSLATEFATANPDMPALDSVYALGGKAALQALVDEACKRLVARNTETITYAGALCAAIRARTGHM